MKGYQVNRVHVTRKGEVEAYLYRQVSARDVRYKSVTSRFINVYFTAAEGDWINKELYETLESLRSSVRKDHDVPRYEYNNGGFSRILPAFTQEECDAYVLAHKA